MFKLSSAAFYFRLAEEQHSVAIFGISKDQFDLFDLSVYLLEEKDSTVFSLFYIVQLQASAVVIHQFHAARCEQTAFITTNSRVLRML